MKDFSILCNLELLSQPDWLNDFRERYDEAHPYHVTLKNSTYLQKGSEEDIKTALHELLMHYSPFKLQFKKVFNSLTKRGECIMIEVEKGLDLIKLTQLQQEVRVAFARFGIHIKSSFLYYEENFNPHITIGRHLDSERFEHAWNEVLTHDCQAFCVARVSAISLVFANAENEQESLLGRVSLEYPLYH
jgi:2'-5' RNA ligase